MPKQEIQFEDDAKEPMTLMIEHRLPWLAVGFVGGIGAILISARFEALIAKNIQLAFFIPIIVYMADAMGHQAESVFVRNLGREKVKFTLYLIKEFTLGVILGSIFGFVIGLFAYFWFHSVETALTVGYAMLITMSLSPLVALTIPEIIWKEHRDPAVGAGPFATVIQDICSLLIYFSIATVVLL